jgi:GDP-4-dehydro-6-deoxy-D-mannose reductase
LKILVTGGNGFVAGYASRELAAAGHTTVLSDHFFGNIPEDGIERITADLTKADEIDRLVSKTQSDACIHLGGITSVVIADRDPVRLFNVNVTGTAILLEAFRNHCPAARFLFVSTAHVYGRTEADGPIDESAPLKPSNLYAASKASADILAATYAGLYGMHVMTTRPNNHVGPGQSPDFVLGTFSKQIKAISRGKAAPVILTGNLESTRDFTDVRDVARAYRLLLEKGTKGASYNIGSGSQVSIREILRTMCRMEGISPEIKPDPERMRPADKSPVLDTSRIRKDTGWKPAIPLDITIRDILEEF